MVLAYPLASSKCRIEPSWWGVEQWDPKIQRTVARSHEFLVTLTLGTLESKGTLGCSPRKPYPNLQAIPWILALFQENLHKSSYDMYHQSNLWMLHILLDRGDDINIHNHSNTGVNQGLVLFRQSTKWWFLWYIKLKVIRSFLECLWFVFYDWKIFPSTNYLKSSHVPEASSTLLAIFSIHPIINVH